MPRGRLALLAIVAVLAASCSASSAPTIEAAGTTPPTTVAPTATPGYDDGGSGDDGSGTDPADVVASAAAAGADTESSGTDTLTAEAAQVPEVLAFEVALIGGGTLHGADLAGEDVLFWFWAPT
ncbi:MAG: hypothetical protein NZ584_06745 [Acidimicrobiales bacterium]|nr:hypothetical protein [Acidimicrobiales bacterium]